MHRSLLLSSLVIAGCATAPPPAVVGATSTAQPSPKPAATTGPWQVLTTLNLELRVPDAVTAISDAPEGAWTTTTLHTAGYAIHVREVQRDTLEPTLDVREANEDLRLGLAEIAARTLEDSKDGMTFLVELDGTSGGSRVYRSYGRYLVSDLVRYDCRGEAESPADRARITAACRSLRPIAATAREGCDERGRCQRN